MGKIVQISDFKGLYAVSQNSFNTGDLQSCIDKYEIIYLRDLLGVTLGNSFYADITTPYSPPVSANNIILFNELFSDEPLIKSLGIKQMLVSFIYFEFTRNGTSKNTITGNVIQQNEVSIQSKWGETSINQVYNESICTYNYIQEYINYNYTTYPTFAGLIKKVAWL
jgi:hypothetical protein